MEISMQILKMDAVRLDGGTQFRKSINQDVVKDYKEKILDDVVLPPIQVTFDGSDYWLWDGFHRYFAIKAIGLTTIESKVTTGSVQDAKRLARKANSHHGLARDYDTKRNAVLDALDDPDNEGLSSREIAKQCDVSHTFVLNVKKPEKKLGNVSKKKEEVETIPTPPLTQDFAPTEEELNANQMAFEADVQAMNKLLESDDALATAHAEIKRLNADYAMLESRFNALMREKDKAVSLLEKAQRELDKVKRAKK
jgi:hypothetical protein